MESLLQKQVRILKYSEPGLAHYASLAKHVKDPLLKHNPNSSQSLYPTLLQTYKKEIPTLKFLLKSEAGCLRIFSLCILEEALKDPALLKRIKLIAYDQKRRLLPYCLSEIGTAVRVLPRYQNSPQLSQLQDECEGTFLLEEKIKNLQESGIRKIFVEFFHISAASQDSCCVQRLFRLYPILYTVFPALFKSVVLEGANLLNQASPGSSNGILKGIYSNRLSLYTWKQILGMLKDALKIEGIEEISNCVYKFWRTGTFVSDDNLYIYRGTNEDTENCIKDETTSDDSTDSIISQIEQKTPTNKVSPFELTPNRYLTPTANNSNTIQFSNICSFSKLPLDSQKLNSSSDDHMNPERVLSPGIRHIQSSTNLQRISFINSNRVSILTCQKTQPNVYQASSLDGRINFNSFSSTTPGRLYSKIQLQETQTPLAKKYSRELSNKDSTPSNIQSVNILKPKTQDSYNSGDLILRKSSSNFDIQKLTLKTPTVETLPGSFGQSNSGFSTNAKLISFGSVSKLGEETISKRIATEGSDTCSIQEHPLQPQEPYSLKIPKKVAYLPSKLVVHKMGSKPVQMFPNEEYFKGSAPVLSNYSRHS